MSVSQLIFNENQINILISIVLYVDNQYLEQVGNK